MKKARCFPSVIRKLFLITRLYVFPTFLLFASHNMTAQNGAPMLELVKDINATPTSALTFNDYSQWTDVNGNLFFVLKNRQLWVVTQADPTAVLLQEFGSISQLANVNGTLYFSANDGVHGNELWMSNGTPHGTNLVKDIRPGSIGSDPISLTAANGLVYFSAHDGLRGRELWKSDGTAAGTMIVKDIMRIVGSSNPSELVGMNGLLYFVANDGQHGFEVWRSDGTTSGTQILKDIYPQRKSSSFPRELVAANGKLFFVAFGNNREKRLWVSDGTEAGTMMVAEAGTPTAMLESMTKPKQLTNVNGMLYFVGRDPEHGFELWKSDGTAAGTQLVKDIAPGSRNIQYLQYLTSHNNLAYFVGVSSYELWVSDGSEEGTMMLTHTTQLRLSGFPDLTPFNGMVYFLGLDVYNSPHIYRVGETPESVESFLQHPEGYYAFTHLTASGDYLYYVREGTLWRTDGVDHQVINGIFDRTEDSNPQHIIVDNGTMYFSAFDGVSYGLWKSNGTETGTTLIHRFERDVQYLTISGNYLYYWGNSIDTDDLQLDLKLWRTDLATDETTWVSDINKGGGDYLGDLEDVNGTLFFSIEVPVVAGQEFPREAQLWKTTGTLSSTEYIATFNDAGLPPTFLTNVNGTLFFSAVTDRNVGEELWKSDGTPAGTVMVKKINPNPLEPSAPSYLVNVNNTLFFSAYTGQYELWKSDGTEAGTVRVKAINPFGLTNLDNMLYFYSSNELWKSDGTDSGTVKVASFTAPEGAWVYSVSVLGKLGDDIIVGTQYSDLTALPAALWKTNGTEEGTEIILHPVDNLTSFSNVTVNNNIIYFTGSIRNTPTYHLWRTDGTSCGTFVVESEGNPDDLLILNGKIYLSWTHETFGREMFLLDERQINDACTEVRVAYKEAPDDDVKVISSYPNPFNNHFVLNVPGKDNETYGVRIIDMRSKKDNKYVELFYNTDYTLGEGLVPGIYMLEVREGKRIVTTKMIKTP